VDTAEKNFRKLHAKRIQNFQGRYRMVSALPQEEQLMYWRRLARAFKDRVGMPMDKGIIELVALFNAFGFPTDGSCQGHASRGDMPYVRVLLPALLPHFRGWREERTWWRSQRARDSAGQLIRRSYMDLYRLLDDFSHHQSARHRAMSFASRPMVQRMGDVIDVHCVIRRDLEMFSARQKRTILIEAQQNFQDLAAFMLKRFLAPTARH